MKKIPKDLFSKDSNEPGKTMAFHARADLVSLIEKNYKASGAKSLSVYLATVVGWALKDDKKKAG